MKLLHITASYKPAYIYGGPVMSVAKLCEELMKSKEQRAKSKDIYEGDVKNLAIERGLQPATNIVVYTTLANGAEELPYPSDTVKIVEGVEVYYFKRLTKDHSHFSPALFWKLWKTAKDYDLIHIHAWWNLVTMVSCLIALLRGVKVIVTPRGTLSTYSFYNRSSKIKRLFHTFMGARMLNRCHFHLTSNKEALDTAELLKPKSLTVIPNFVELPWQQKEAFSISKKPTETLKLIFLSRIEEKKGLAFLFDALANVHFPYHLRIAGTGEAFYISSLQKKAVQLGIADHVSWLGMLNKEEKFDELHQNDVFVLPSFDENFANVVIESLFAGTPVLITKNVGLSDYINEKNLGWVCERDIFALTKQLEKSYEDTQTSKISSTYLTETIANDYKEAKIIERYLDFYAQIIASRA